MSMCLKDLRSCVLTRSPTSDELARRKLSVAAESLGSGISWRTGQTYLARGLPPPPPRATVRSVVFGQPRGSMNASYFLFVVRSCLQDERVPNYCIFTLTVPHRAVGMTALFFKSVLGGRALWHGARLFSASTWRIQLYLRELTTVIPYVEQCEALYQPLGCPASRSCFAAVPSTARYLCYLYLPRWRGDRALATAWRSHRQYGRRMVLKPRSWLGAEHRL